MRSIQSKRRSRAQLLAFRAFASLSFILLAIGLMLHGDANADAEHNTCIECHADSKLLVQNKKLFDYFQEWKISIHALEGITCDECHGGDPSVADKKKSHLPGVAPTDEASGIYFRNVVETCGDCHEEILNSFKQSEHFKHVAAKQQEDQGPTCVTCHGSIDVEILGVTSVTDSCVRCHNDDSDNHPENPDKAKVVLDRIHSINRFYRYIVRRIEPSERGPFFEEVDAKLHHFSITWHTFDWDDIDAESSDLFDQLKSKREEIKKKSREAKEEASN